MQAPSRIRLRDLILSRIPPENPWARLRELIALSAIPRPHAIVWTEDAQSFVLNLIRHCERQGDGPDGVSALQCLIEALVGLGGFTVAELEEMYGLTGVKAQQQAAPAVAPRSESQLKPAPEVARAGQGLRRALVVGITTYDERSGLADLKFADKDATEVESLLKDWGGFETTRLTGHVTVRALREALVAVRQGLGPKDTVVLFYSGHGCRAGESAVLASSDYEPAGSGQALMKIEEVREVMSGVGQVVQLLDACHLGIPFAKGAGDDLSARLITRTRGWVCIAAANIDQAAVERRSLGHGLFTHYLLQALRGAVGHRTDQHLLVDAVSIAAFVAFALEADGAAQQPRTSADLVGTLVLTALKAAPRT